MAHTNINAIDFEAEEERTVVIPARCKLLPGAFFRVTFVPDEEITCIALYRDEASALGGKLDGFLGEDFQDELSPAQLSAVWAAKAGAQ